MQPRRVVVPTLGKEKRCDPIHRPVFQFWRGHIGISQKSRFGNVNGAHNHGSQTRPLQTLAGPINHPTMMADPAQTCGTCIALCDGVGGDQPKAAAGPDQAK